VRISAEPMRRGLGLPRSSALAIAGEETRDARNRVAEVIFMRQENEAEVIGNRPVEAAALNQQHTFFLQQFGR
jgi:hypothetical protein